MSDRPVPPPLLFLEDLATGQRFESTTYPLDAVAITRFEIKWPHATRPGDILRAEIEIVDIKPSKSRADRGRVKLHVTTRNQNGNAVLILDVMIVVPKRQTET